MCCVRGGMEMRASGPSSAPSIRRKWPRETSSWWRARAEAGTAGPTNIIRRKKMNPTAIYSKSGKGVQEAAGKTSLLQRPDRAVLSAIDGRATLADVAQKVGKTFDAAFQAVITKLDKDGFIREVSPGAASAAAPKPAAAAPKPAAKPAARAEPAGGDLDFSSLGTPSRPAPPRPAAPPKPAAPAPKAAGDALDFSSLGTPSKPGSTPQQSALNKAREEAEAKQQADRDRLKKEAEAKTRAEMEVKLRAEAEQKQKEEAEAKVKAEASAKAEAEAKIKAAREAALRAAEAKVKAEQEAKAKAEARIEAKRKAREEAERKAKEAERARRELEEERKRLEAERKRVEEEREAQRRKRAEEEAAREAEEEAARAAKRKLREEEEAMQAIAAAAAKPAKALAKAGSKKDDTFADSLLQDLDNFTNKDEEDAKARDQAERQAKAEAEQRAREDAERQEKEEAERREREEEEARRRGEEARRAGEEEERRDQEEERRKREAEEIHKKAEAATAAAMAKEGKKVPPKAEEEDIPVGDDDLDMDEVKREQAQLAKGKEREEKAQKDREKEDKKKKPSEAEPLPRVRRRSKLGKPIALTLGFLLLVALGVAHVMPLNTAEYERTATEALGRPVRIGSANLWLLTGLQVRFKNVAVGDAKIAHVTGYPSTGSLFGDRKEFSKIELDGFTLPQEAIGDALFATVKSDGFSVEQFVIKSLEVPGPATLPKSLQADIALNEKGTMKSATLRGPDGLLAKLVPQDDGVRFEMTAAGFTLPIAPQVTLSNFAMKGSATPRGMTITEWGGSLLGGGMSGTANVRWGGSWNVDGVVTVRNINAAVFAPALLSSGTGEGTAKFSMNAPDPGGLVSAGRIDGNFTVYKGALGSFDLATAIQSGGRNYRGTTQFVEMNGQGSYNRGAVSLRNVTIGAGALNAGASADISENGALSGRIVADMRTTVRALSATLLLGGTLKEPQVRN